MLTERQLRSFVTLHSIVGAAAMDMGTELSMMERKYNHWAVRGLKKLYQESFKSGKRYSLLTINKNLNNAHIPCDVEEILFIGYVNSKGYKVPFKNSPNLVDIHNIDEIECEEQCEAKCDCCFPKQMCRDLEETLSTNELIVNGETHLEYVKSTLMPNGEYFVEKTTPYWDAVDQQVRTRDTKEYVTTFDVADCGCIKETEENKEKLECHCYDAYCTYVTPCSCDPCPLRYQVFEGTDTIQFENTNGFSKVYMEWRGSVPKVDGYYVVPKVAYETLVNWIKYKSVENNKSVSLSERREVFNNYKTERENMLLSHNRLTLAEICEAISGTPKF